jgi:DNA-binding winged helix-turn-helix (wHTH) protein/tetratricopeptide (TPR) repeat protein
MQDQSIYEFGRFRLDPAEHLLLCDGVQIPLTGKAFQVLLVLVRRNGHLIERSELVAAVWGDTFIEEGNLTVTISTLRKVLGDDRSENRFIETVAKQGYRFLPSVTKVAAGAADEPEISHEFLRGELVSMGPGPLPASSHPWSRYVSGGLAVALGVIATVGLLVQTRVQAARGMSHAALQSVPPQGGTEAEAGKAVSPGSELLPKPGRRSSDPEAYRLYVEGRYFWNKRTESGFRRSIECFQQAILKDPNYPDAYAGLADSYTLLASYGVEPPAQAYPNAKAAAMKALQLDDGLAEAHTSLGMVALYYEWDWRQAGQQFRRAIDLNPNYPQAHAWDSLYFGAMGEVPQALQQALWAQQLDPLSLVMNMDLGSVYYWSRQYDEAVNTYRYAISLDPYFARAHSRLGMVLAVQRDYPGAIHEFEEARKLSGPDPYIDGLIGYAQALSGNQKAARRLLAKLTERSHHEYVPAFSLALLCLGLGDRARAMDWFERAYQDRSTYMIYAKVDPLLDPLRSDQRFVSLLEQMDLKELGTPNKLAKTSDPPTRIIDVAMR